MGRAPCCEKKGLKRGRWTVEEDAILAKYIAENGEGSWRSLPKNAGLLRCGKSCRLRWLNYLRADLKRGSFSKEEDEIIIKFHSTIGNRWSIIAAQLPGRTDNEIKNYWNSHLSRRINIFRRQAGRETFIFDLGSIPAGANRRGGRTSRAAMKKNSTVFISANSIGKNQTQNPNRTEMSHSNSSLTFDFDLDLEEVLGPDDDIRLQGNEKELEEYSAATVVAEKVDKFDLERLEAMLWEEDGSDTCPWMWDPELIGDSSFDDETLSSWLLA